MPCNHKENLTEEDEALYRTGFNHGMLEMLDWLEEVHIANPKQDTAWLLAAMRETYLNGMEDLKGGEEERD